MFLKVALKAHINGKEELIPLTLKIPETEVPETEGGFGPDLGRDWGTIGAEILSSALQKLINEAIKTPLRELQGVITVPICTTDDSEITCIGCGRGGRDGSPCDYEIQLGTSHGRSSFGLHDRCKARAEIFTKKGKNDE